MKITICGSIQFCKEMEEIQKKLEKMGHTVYVPKSIELMKTSGYKIPTTPENIIKHKIEYDFIRDHFRKIEKSDGVLIINLKKRGINNYIGGNTFLEMGYAFGLRKKIYLMYPIPKMDYAVEMHAMEPIVIEGNIQKIGE